MSFKEEWRKRFESFASSEDDDAGIAGWSQTGLETRIHFFRSFWSNSKSAGDWLDVGCGAGTYSRILRDEGKNVVAFDYSYPTLVKARERDVQEEGGCPILWALGDATELPVADSSVTGALALGVSQALPESDSLIDELMRVVKQGGEVWIDSLNRSCLPHIWIYMKRKFRHKNIHLRYESASLIKASLLRAGADRVEIRWMPILPGRLHSLQKTMIKLSPLFQLPIISHLFCHSFLIKARKG